MRRLIAPIALLALCGCARHDFPEGTTIEDTSPRLSAVVHTADPKTAAQLVKGFHDVEGNAWRWTAKQFAVTLHVPPGSNLAGARLVLNFSVPEVIATRLGAVTLSARIGEARLTPETVSGAGEYIYAREVPAAALAGETALVEFSLDKALPPGSADARELGIVASTIALEPK